MQRSFLPSECNKKRLVVSEKPNTASRFPLIKSSAYSERENRRAIVRGRISLGIIT